MCSDSFTKLRSNNQEFQRTSQVSGAWDHGQWYSVTYGELSRRCKAHTVSIQVKDERSTFFLLGFLFCAIRGLAMRVSEGSNSIRNYKHVASTSKYIYTCEASEREDTLSRNIWSTAKSSCWWHRWCQVLRHLQNQIIVERYLFIYKNRSCSSSLIRRVPCHVPCNSPSEVYLAFIGIEYMYLNV